MMLVPMMCSWFKASLKLDALGMKKLVHFGGMAGGLRDSASCICHGILDPASVMQEPAFWSQFSRAWIRDLGSRMKDPESM